MQPPPDTSTGDDGFGFEHSTLDAVSPAPGMPPADASTTEPAGALTDTPVDDSEGETTRRGRRKKRSGAKSLLEWVILIASAFAIALLIKTFLFQAFYIPSESMVPTLEKNDRVLVNKLSYRLHAVHRGDIVVFKAPRNPDGTLIDPTVKDLVKRVIGLPGDVVSARDGKVFVNGHALNEPYLPDGTRTDCASFTEHCFRTKLPADGKIPKDEYWVMGDNRPSSKDSRFFGPIKKKDIVGRVFIRIWPLNRLDLL